MAERETRRMTLEEFLAWDPGDDERYELVDGVPVAMTGARRAHDRVVANTITELTNALGDGPCWPHTGDLGLRTGPTTLRRPDVTVDCGEKDLRGLLADRPVVLIEVLSVSTRRFDKLFKSAEYKRIESVQQILLVDPEEAVAMLHDRTENGWNELPLVGRETVIDLWSIGVRLSLGRIYRGLI